MPTPSVRENLILNDTWNSPAEQSILELLWSISDQDKRSLTATQIARETTCSLTHIKKCLSRLARQEYIFTPSKSGLWFFNTDDLDKQYKAKMSKFWMREVNHEL